MTPQALLEKIRKWIPKREPAPEEEPPAPPQTKAPSLPFKAHEEPKLEESDFMRYVKLRIPETGVATPPIEGQAASPPSPDMLAIRPDLQTSVRPSLSRKGAKEALEAPAGPPKPKNAEPAQPKKTAAAPLPAPLAHSGDYNNYQIPNPSLLTNAKKIDQSSLKQNLRRQAEVLEETMTSFGIEAKVGQINCGPTITSFEVHPAIGVKVQKIKTLENDIALNMEAKSIRIIAPIPGKAAVGIEVPNPQPQEVGFKEMLMAYQQGSAKFRIPILLGKAVNGDYVMSDLAKMPHCIIAGATGSGKSVCINTIVMSILLNAKPDEIRLVMVDPKKVELTPYTRLPHMLAPVITEPQGACAALRWLVKEMENRYELLKLLGVRNIDGFNSRTINKEFEESLERPVPARLPYLVGIIDELADLMMVASQDIETPIARIAQMARAVGIHLILATQRPSREVITGLIKANFPTRISFKVASRVNSQIVLDEIGAESLLGNGDMLFLPPGSSTLIRAQGAFIRDEDINAVVKQICDQAPPNYVIESFDKMSSGDGEEGDGGDDEPEDNLYEDAKEVILSTGNASTTFLQRKLKIGYARAASIIDQLERRGVVGPAEGAKPRKILAARRKDAEEGELSMEEALADEEMV
jgi:S-DNA-T family DNA segregation ATPase FtsK/SpoIIIE